jgi:hypothetical protein
MTEVVTMPPELRASLVDILARAVVKALREDAEPESDTTSTTETRSHVRERAS